MLIHLHVAKYDWTMPCVMRPRRGRVCLRSCDEDKHEALFLAFQEPLIWNLGKDGAANIDGTNPQIYESMASPFPVISRLYTSSWLKASTFLVTSTVLFELEALVT